jgi:hypothetical protein
MYSPFTIVAAAAVAGLGTALFFPANNSAVMANAAKGYYGATNGLLRTMQNIGGLMSYVIVIYVASSAVPRSIAFQVFVGTTQLLGGLTSAFIDGIHTALLAAAILMIVAGVMSYARGRAKTK